MATGGDARAQAIEQRLPGALGNLVAHQDANLFELLPFAVEGEGRRRFAGVALPL